MAGCLRSVPICMPSSGTVTQRAWVTSCQRQRNYMGPQAEDRSHAGLGAFLCIWPQSGVTVKQEDKTAGEGEEICLIPLNLGSNGCVPVGSWGQQAVIKKNIFSEWLLEQFSLGHVNGNFSQIQGCSICMQNLRSSYATIRSYHQNLIYLTVSKNTATAGVPVSWTNTEGWYVFFAIFLIRQKYYYFLMFPLYTLKSLYL